VGLTVVSAQERPDLADRADEETASTHEEWQIHGDVSNRYWGSLYDVYREFQLVLYDETGDAVLGEGNTIPCFWDETVEGLPAGIDEVIGSGFPTGGGPVEGNNLSALNIRIVPGHEGKGYSKLLLQAMRELAGARGFANVIAPVLPNWKHRYPLIPIEEYAHWQRDDGLPFDPWIRVHHRLGADLLRVAPRSRLVSGTVAEWEEWTGLEFPATGDYVLPGGLAPMRIDHDRDLGVYWEPNVWMRHRAG
jgi:GNAT superfamily N-acetyltransferase